MANASRFSKSDSASEQQLKLLYGDDAITKYWSSSLFNIVYLRHDISEKHPKWKSEDEPDFQHFLNELRNIATDYKDREKELFGWSETETINNLVKRLLGGLGWENNCTGKLNPYLEETSFRYDNKTYRTDILIVDLPNEKMYVKEAVGVERIQVARDSVLMPVEVKYWQRLEEYRQGKKEEKRRADNGSDDIARTSTPNEQTVQYMDILKKNWGILTDGARWRLFNNQMSSEDSERYYEFNFYSLLQAMATEETLADSLEITEAAKYFYHFFSKSAFYPKDEGEQPFVDEVLKYSKKYVSKVEEDLKDRFVKAMNIACNGFFKAAGAAEVNQDLTTVRNVSESALFNVLFIKSLESRSVLPMASTDYKKISLSSMVDKIERFDPKKEDLLNCRELERAFKKGNGNSFTYQPRGVELHDRILRLTGAIHRGASSKDKFGFEISGFKETIFSPEEWKMFEKCKLTNHDWVRILFELGYAESESLNRRYQQIPYGYFTPRQLGSIYESFLEFKLDKAPQDMVFERKQWKPASIDSPKYRLSDIPKVKKGELFFTPDNEDRKATGSYYTPDNVVQFIVRETIEPLIKKNRPDEILKLKICDPAMGSGHFLSGALRYITWAYLNHSENSEDASLSDVKSAVLHNCIFGSDLNPRAVKLAKLSLWLETATANRKLEPLDDQIKCTNSLTDVELWKNEWGFLKNGIDAVVGNPPYLGEKGHKEVFQEIAPGWLGERFYQGKMDLLYFFFHLGLDILKPNGRLGFITTNYFPTATGGTKLRKDFCDRASLRMLMNLNEVRVFGEAAGQHNMITVLAKGKDEEPAMVIATTEKSKVCSELLAEIVSGTKGTVLNIPQEELYDGEEFYIRLGSTASNKFSKKDLDGILEKVRDGSVRLDSLFHVNQGIVTGADKVSERHLKKFEIKADKGDGIFVLKSVEQKILSTSSKSLLKPWFKNSDIRPFTAERKSNLAVLYIDREATNIPADVKSHLSKYKTALDSRREVQNDVIQWFQLQWPRTNEIFSDEKIVAPQRSKMNVFGYDNGEWYASADVYFITRREKGAVELKFALGLLNSKVMLAWLYFMGKRKGEMLELYQKPLCEVPVRAFDSVVRNGIIREVEKLIKNPGNPDAYEQLNQKIYLAYGLNKAEIKAVEAFYDSRAELLLAAEEDQEDEEAA